MREYPVMDPSEGLTLFYPTVPKTAIDEVAATLATRWIGQGPRVERFEQQFKAKYLIDHSPLAVGSGTDALHLAYLLAGLQADDEVLVPVFTCTATNIPLLYIGAKVNFVDIDPQTMNISIADLKRKINDRTRAIVTVDYGGICCDYDEINSLALKYNIPVIQDAAHSLGSRYDGKIVGSFSDFVIFSFQAIKTLTTGDGGMLAIRNKTLLPRAKKLRWFGIDRESKQGGIWENDIVDVGYKYQMTDIAAAMGLGGLEKVDSNISHRKAIFAKYQENLKNFSGVKVIAPVSEKALDFCPWLLTVLVEGDRVGLMDKLREQKIESAQVHFRNDRYSIFGQRRKDLPVMDELEHRYLVLPSHPRVTLEQVDKVCSVVKSGW
ncbi:MAG: DegT/DnrJ/EryC1/StrS family aminotransferase [Candidatus Riflebacteria bacterium]|nr:DegT/DnrJ/EryC1/StrS family aminotransferase [Candidatus Riflebacteria bacterium]